MKLNSIFTALVGCATIITAIPVIPSILSFLGIDNNESSNTTINHPNTDQNNLTEEIATVPTEEQVISYKIVFEDSRCVDLGLSIRWASCNVGATTPEDFGDYFAWGETEPKKEYDWETYKWCRGSFDTLTKYCTSSNAGIVDNLITLDLEDDAAHVNWGGEWRMPTSEEFEELIDKCCWKWIIRGSVSGYEIIGPSGRIIFLPSAGYFGGETLQNAGNNGLYWTNTMSESDNSAGILLVTDSEDRFQNCFDRCFGYCVRPVCQ